MEKETTLESLEPRHKLQTKAVSRYENVVENGIKAGF
jgi:hypothetical protein